MTIFSKRGVPDVYHDYIFAKITGIRSAAIIASEFGHCTTSELTIIKTISIDDVIHTIQMSPLKQFRTCFQCGCSRSGLSHSLHTSCISSTSHLSTWKFAIVTSILKKVCSDDSNVFSNRPVSNLPHLFKILERFVNRQLIKHLEEFKL